MKSVGAFLFVLSSLLPCPAQQDSYIYHGKTIALQRDLTSIAAIVHPNVALESKYPRISSNFNILASSKTRADSLTIVSKVTAPLTAAERTLASAIRAKEAAQIPVYRLGNLRLVLQNELIVSFKSATLANDAKTLLSRFSSLFIEITPNSGRYLVRLGNPKATLRISAVLQGNKSIVYAEPNFVVIQSDLSKTMWSPPHSVGRAVGPLDAAADEVPSDPLFDQEWALYNNPSSSQGGTTGVDIKALQAWKITKGSPNIKVAVLDEGIDSTHPDLVANIAKNGATPIQYDAILDSVVQQPAPSDNHGTRVAGIIAATANQIGMIGVAPNATLIPIRVGSTSDSPEGAWTTPVIVDQGLQKAITLGADVINISWEINPSSLVTDSLTAALTKGRNGIGSVVVCAAGNDGGPVVYPANLSSELPIIAVGAINAWGEVKTKISKDGEYWWASNVGPEISVVAPGIGIVTTDLGSSTDPSTGVYVTTFNGTSSATPIVSGIAALLLSVNSKLTPTDVRNLIQTTASRASTGRTNDFGWGFVNACAALSASAGVAQSCN